MAGRVFPLLQHFGEAQETRADVFGSPGFAQARHARRKVATGAVADGAGRGHRARLFQCDRAETAVQPHRGQAMRTAIGADRACIIGRHGGRGGEDQTKRER